MVPEQLVNGVNLQDGQGRTSTSGMHGCVVHIRMRQLHVYVRTYNCGGTNKTTEDCTLMAWPVELRTQ